MKFIHKSQSGSSILLVFGIVTVITLCFSGVFYSTSRLTDIVHKRELYAQKKYATESLLNYGIAFVRAHYPILREYAQNSGQEIIAYFDQWCIGDGKEYTGVTTIGLRGEIAFLTATLYYDGHERYRLSCSMRPANTDDMSYKIYDWRIH